jgi:GH15 family glucan-1,4-alpha-glucosidase
MSMKIEEKRYRMPLCPYLMIGNRRVLVHLDAYCVPQSLQWPRPGAADRLAWRDLSDEWPYWEEMSPEAIRVRMPYFEYSDGSRDYLHEATTVETGYIEDTNVLEGRYFLPGGSIVEITTFVHPQMDVWVRHYKVRGQGKLILQSEFFEKAVRGHTLSHLGDVNFRGFFNAAPRGAYVIMSTIPLSQTQQRVEIPVTGETCWTLFMCMADDILEATKIGKQALKTGYDSLKEESIAGDLEWVSRAKEPISRHPFILKNYRRWLLSNILLTAHDGIMICGVRPFWSFAWPRDCSQQAAGFAAAGFIDEARRIIKWNLDNTPESGVHDARYWADGTPVLLDNRPRQGDSAGFLCWAATFISRQSWDRAWVETIKDKVYFLADHLVKDRDEETLLPLPEADHRETQIASSISIVLSAIGGLTEVADFANRLGDATRAKTYLLRAEELRCAAEKLLWNKDDNYFITSLKPLNVKTDISLCWGAYPFMAWKPDDPKMIQSVLRVFRERWNASAGGVLSSPGTPYESFWMYYTSILLLGVAGIGEKDKEMEILGALERNVSPQGLIPEQVSRATGNLWGCNPLSTPQGNLLLCAYDLTNSFTEKL